MRKIPGFLWPALLILTIWILLFWPMMSGRTIAGFRDSTQLYYPLFQFIDQTWASGEIPLWNPYDNFGAPLLADGTSSVFYPGKLIYLCRFLGYPSRYGIYLALHVLLAAAGTYWLARTMRASVAGATLAAISYAFGGSLFFQLHNVVYLVSGAWLPLALGCVWKMAGSRSFAWPAAAAVCCSMMILGGDPQMVYHVGLIAVATLGGEFLRRRRRQFKNRNHRAHPGAYRWWTGAMLRMGVLVILTAGLSAVQLLPTAKWSERSERISSPEPQNIYQAVDLGLGSAAEFNDPGGSRLNPDWYEMPIEEIHVSLFEKPVPGSVKDHRYQFSFPPWSLVELVWPNFSGKPYPTHRRWTDRLAGAERIWVPSAYAGLVTLLLALSAATIRKTRRRARWLTLTGMFFCVASFGWFGLAWLVNEFNLLLFPPQPGGSSFDLRDLFGPQVGGLYWAMTMVLPKYFVFRYPAKLFMVASLCMCVLAGTSLRRQRIATPRSLWPIVIASIAGIFVVWSGWAQNRFSEIGANPLFGPFEMTELRWDLTAGFVHTILVVTVFAGIAWCQTKFALSKSNACAALILLATLDVVVANQWMKLEIDSGVMTSDVSIDERLESAREQVGIEIGRPLVEPLTVYRSRDRFPIPNTWAQESSPKRISELVIRQRETLAPKNHLQHRVALVGSFTSIWPMEYEYLLKTIKRPPLNQSFKRFAGIQRRLAAGHIRQGELVADGFTSNSGFGRVLAFVDVDGNNAFEITQPVTPARCEVLSFKNNEIQLSASSQGNETLLLNLLSDDGWKIELTDKAGNTSVVERAACHPCFTAIPLTENGQFNIRLVYDPVEFRVGAWISGICWSALFFVFTTLFSRHCWQERSARRFLTGVHSG
ncbi:MAG: hypothetical protein AAF456_18980 [Planctomycetota bacterium]